MRYPTGEYRACPDNITSQGPAVLYTYVYARTKPYRCMYVQYRATAWALTVWKYQRSTYRCPFYIALGKLKENMGPHKLQFEGNKDTEHLYRTWILR